MLSEILVFHQILTRFQHCAFLPKRQNVEQNCNYGMLIKILEMIVKGLKCLRCLMKSFQGKASGHGDSSPVAVPAAGAARLYNLGCLIALLGYYRRGIRGERAVPHSATV